MDKYIIYQHINKVNGKRYIGQTSQDVERRWRPDGMGYKECPKFYRAIKKYGWDNFEHEIIEIGDSQEWANEREIYWIAYYDTFNNDDKGYNMTPGGNNYMKELWQDPEYRDKMCKSFASARKRDWSNEQFANKQLENMLNGIQKAWSNTEWREKRIAAITGDKNPNAKAVVNIETNKIFNTMKEAAEWAHVGQGGIGECCKGKKISCGKHPEFGYSLHWKYLNSDNNIDFEALEDNRGKHKNTKKVKCLNTGVIFKSAEEASKWAGLKRKDTIYRCCKGTIKTAGKNPETGEACSWEYVPEGVM